MHLYSSGVLVYSFLVISFSDYGVKLVLALWNEFGTIFSSSIFWKRNVFAVVGGSSVYGVEMEDVGRSWRARKHRSS